MRACIMWLAVLSSLLNLILGVTSGIDAEESCEADSTVFSTVVMHLLVKGGSTAAQCNKPGLELLLDTDTEGMPLLDGVAIAAWEPILVCKNKFVSIIQRCLDLRKLIANNSPKKISSTNNC